MLEVLLHVARTRDVDAQEARRPRVCPSVRRLHWPAPSHPVHDHRRRPALAAWLQLPGDGPVLEFEQLLKISFADSGTKADILANLDAARAWVAEQNEENLATARAYLDGRGLFPERAALNQLAGRFLTDFYVTVARWVEWASDVVQDWPDDVRLAPLDRAAQQEAVRLAESVDATVQRSIVT